MKKCNKCNKKKKGSKFKHQNKKTCKSCEFKWWHYYLRLMVRERKLTPTERLSSRIGYMGAGFFSSRSMDIKSLSVYYRVLMCNDTDNST